MIGFTFGHKKSARVTLINGNTSIQSYAMLDKCSSCSYICKVTAEKLKSTPKHSVDLQVRGAFSMDKSYSTLIKLNVAALKSASVLLTLPNVYSVEQTRFFLVNIKKLNHNCSKFNHLSHINYPELEDNHVRVFLIVDAFWFVAERDMKKGSVGSPFAIKN